MSLTRPAASSATPTPTHTAVIATGIGLRPTATTTPHLATTIATGTLTTVTPSALDAPSSACLTLSRTITASWKSQQCWTSTLSMALTGLSKSLNSARASMLHLAPASNQLLTLVSVRCPCNSSATCGRIATLASLMSMMALSQLLAILLKTPSTSM